MDWHDSARLIINGRRRRRDIFTLDDSLGGDMEVRERNVRQVHN